MTYYATMQSPIGSLLLTSDGTSLTGLYMPGPKSDAPVHPDWVPDANAPPLQEAIRQLQEYFARKRTEFDVPLAPSGTDFQRSVWKALLDIPYGTVVSYGEVARRIGNPNASRAVGLANARNPISIIVPCHRVVGANGRVTGYGGGPHRREALLELEGANPMMKSK